MDCQLVVIGPRGRIDLTHVTGFKARQRATPVRVERIDTSQLVAEFPPGWDGQFNLERGGSAVEEFIVQIEAAYVKGRAVPAITLYQYVSEPDGRTGTYQYVETSWQQVFRKQNQMTIHFSSAHRRRI